MMMSGVLMKESTRATNVFSKRGFQHFEIVRFASCQLDDPHPSLCFIDGRGIAIFSIIKYSDRFRQ